MSYLGDYTEDYADLNFKFTSRQFSSGAPFTLANTPSLAVYKSNNITQTTAGITLTADFDGVTGLNNVKIDLSADAFYVVGEDYHVVIAAGTVDSVSVIGEVVATFSIENRFEEVDVTKLNGEIIQQNGGAIYAYNHSGSDLLSVDNVTVANGAVDANVIFFDSQAVTAAASVTVHTDVGLNATAQAGLEDQFDGTGLVGDEYPLRQDQGASISGGLAIRETATSVTVIQGSEQNLPNANTSNNTYWTGDDDGAGAEFIFRFVPADTDSSPGDLHFEGFYNEPGAPFDNSATLETYSFKDIQWDVQETLLNSSVDETHDDQLSNSYRSPGSDTIEGVAVTIGDVLVKFKQTSQETGNATLNIDHMTVGFISSPLTASEIVDEWEAQSQLDPTGFHVNIQEWVDTVVTISSTSAKPEIDVFSITDSAPAAAILKLLSLDALTSGTVDDGSPSASQYFTNLTEDTSDHFNNMVIVFTTGVLKGQTRPIADYDGAGKTITVDPAHTEAPGNGDAFIILGRIS